jgi:site-specific recombinase XerD
MTNNFTLKLYKEKDGWVRLTISSYAIRGRLTKRVGKGNIEDFTHLKNDIENQLNTEYSVKSTSKDKVKQFINFIINSKYKDKICLFNFLQNYLNEKGDITNAKTGKKTSPDTINKYHHDINEFKSFLIQNFNSTEPRIINKKVLDDYFYFLKKKYTHNTSVKKHHYIKNFLKYIEELDIPISKTFHKSKFNEDYTHLMVQDDDIALKLDEYLKLVELKRKIDTNPNIIPNGNYSEKTAILIAKSQNEKKRKNVKLVLDCFLWMCSTGMYLESDIKNGATIKKIGKLIQYNRTKNNSVCNGIISKGDDIFLVEELSNEYNISNNSNFPIKLSETTFKKHLKTICSLAKLNMKITPKTGRKTFASINYFDLGMPLRIVSTMLGHQSEEQTKHYLRITHNSLEEEIFKLRGIAI